MCLQISTRLFIIMGAEISMVSPISGVENLYLTSADGIARMKSLHGRSAILITVLHAEVEGGIVDEFQEVIYIEASDIETQNLYSHFDVTCTKIHQTLRSGIEVYVHCMAGISRSSTIVAAYLIKYHRMTVEEALNTNKETRSCINPNAGFRRQLQQWYIKCNEIRTEINTTRSESLMRYVDDHGGVH